MMKDNPRESTLTSYLTTVPLLSFAGRGDFSIDYCTRSISVVSSAFEDPIADSGFDKPMGIVVGGVVELAVGLPATSAPTESATMDNSVDPSMLSTLDSSGYVFEYDA